MATMLIYNTLISYANKTRNAQVAHLPSVLLLQLGEFVNERLVVFRLQHSSTPILSADVGDDWFAVEESSLLLGFRLCYNFRLLFQVILLSFQGDDVDLRYQSYILGLLDSKFDLEVFVSASADKLEEVLPDRRPPVLASGDQECL